MKTTPAILEKKFSAIADKLNRVKKIVPLVQIDFCDGQFVPTKTYASNGRDDSVKKIVAELKKNKLRSEWDLMVSLDQVGKRQFRTWVEHIKKHEPTRVVFHIGSTVRWDELFSELGGLKTSVGLAVHHQNSLSKVDKIFSGRPFSFFQVMGIREVGHSGQRFSTKTFSTVKNLSDMYPGVPIQVDGGVKIENAAELKKSGAVIVGVNSGLFAAKDMEKRYKEFLDI